MFGSKKRTREAQHDPAAEGRALYRDFRALGDVKGTDKDEIVMFCGPPSSFTVIQGGHIARWTRVGFGADLLFDTEDRCQGYIRFHLD